MGLRIRPDWTGWEAGSPGGIRDGEHALARAGVGLFWTTRKTIDGFDGASRWIARALRLFGDLQGSVDAIETHPHGAFLFLHRRAAPGSRLEPKGKPVGCGQRLDLLKAAIPGLDVNALRDHDAVDAACAALVASLHVLGATRPFGTMAGGGQIWMPS